MSRPNSVLSPCSSQQNEPIYKTRMNRTRTHENYLHQPKYTTRIDPSFSISHLPLSSDVSSRYADCTYLTDLRPTSATSSVRSQDSGVAQSDPKTSIDCSAKSEPSPKVSTHMSRQHVLSQHCSSSTLTRQRSPSSTNQQGEDLEQLRDKLQPLNTARLKPYRQATKSMIVNVLKCLLRVTPFSFRGLLRWGLWKMAKSFSRVFERKAPNVGSSMCFVCRPMAYTSSPTHPTAGRVRCR